MKINSFVTILGVVSSLVYGLVFSSSTYINKGELEIRDELLTWRSSSLKPHPDILLVGIDKPRDLSGNSLKSRKDFYVSIVKTLIQEEANLIVLNLPNEWRNKENEAIITGSENPFNDLIKKHQNKLVLVAPTRKVTKNSSFPILISETPSLISDYSFLLPEKQFLATSDIATSFDITNLQGFFEYERTDSENPLNNQSPNRTFSALGEFVVNTSSEGVLRRSFAWLALEKYYQNQSIQQFSF